MKKGILGCLPGYMMMAVMIRLTVLCGYSQNITVADREYVQSLDDLSIPYTMEIQSPDYTQIVGNTAGFKDRMAMGVVSVGFDDHENLCYSEYHRVVVDFVLQYDERRPGQSPQTITDSRSLEITYDPTSNFNYTEAAHLYLPWAYKVKISSITVTAYKYSGLPFSYTINTFPNDIYVEMKLDFERYYNFSTTTTPAFSNDPSYNATDNKLKITWGNYNAAEEIEIEWAYVNDFDPAGSQWTDDLSFSALKVKFTNNTTRVRLPKYPYEYEIPLIYDKGYLVFRARFIGRDPGNLDKKVYGPWNISAAFGAEIALSTLPVTCNCLYRVDDAASNVHMPLMNWQLSVAYAEEGKSKHVISYADGTFRTRQDVTRISTDDQSIAAQTIYDHQGRPAVQTLPAPTGSKAIKYFPKFNQNTLGQQYSHKDFDIDGTGDCVNMPPAFHTASGAGNYYSPQNLFQQGAQAFVPDAEGYPFTVIQYTPDLTGRIRRQGSVGDEHVLGGNHDTRYLYGMPTQTQLDMLFGSDVGYNGFYKKQAVVDANGQISVSYYDLGGQVIATSLAGEVPENLEPLKDEDDNILAEKEKIDATDDLLSISSQFPQGKNNIRSDEDHTFTFTQQIVVTMEQTYVFNYKLWGEDYSNPCLPDICMDCVYDVEISLTDECQNNMLNGGKYSGILGAALIDEEPVFDTLCNSIDSLVPGAISALLPVGAYTLTKKLTVNQAAVDYYVEKYIQYNTCLKDKNDFFTEPDTSGCAVDCEQCTAELEEMGSFEEYLEAYLSDIPDSIVIDTAFYRYYLEQSYNQKVQDCARICDLGSMNACKAALEGMLIDMRPYGQYASVDRDSITGIADASAYPLSVFNDNNQLPEKQNWQFTVSGFHPGLPTDGPATSWREPKILLSGTWQNYYTDEYGQPARIYLQQDNFGNYSPALVNTGLVTWDNVKSQYYTAPENLMYLTDFVDLFQPSWAKSLLVYHPEYFHYAFCLDQELGEKTVGGEPMTSHAFDAMLSEMDYAEASVLFGPNFDLAVVDPFFQANDTMMTLPLMPLSTFRNQFYFNQVIDFGGTNEHLNLWEAAWFTVHLGGDYSGGGSFSYYENLMPGSCVQAGGSCATTNALLITNDEEWARLVQYYLAQKSSIIRIARSIYALKRKTSNHCFRNELYDLNILPGEVLNPCNEQTYELYADKEVRFPYPGFETDKAPFENDPPSYSELQAYSDQQYYLETGNCRMALDLKNMLARLAIDGLLTSNFHLQNSLYLSYPFSAELGLTGDYAYAPVLSSNDKALTWAMNTGCALHLYFDPQTPAFANFNNVYTFTDIRDVYVSGGVHFFTLKAYVIDNNQPVFFDVSGQVCLPLTGCESSFEAFCKITPQAQQLKKLMGALNEDGLLTSGTPVTLNTNYASILTPELTSPIVPGGTYTWSFNSLLNEFTLANTVSGYELTIAMPPVGTFNYTSGFTVLGMRSPLPLTSTPGSGSVFLLDVAQPGVSPLQLVTLTQGVTHSLQGTLTITGPGVFPVSRCEMLKPLDCQNEENNNIAIVTDILENLLLNDIDNLSLLESSPCVSNLRYKGAIVNVEFSEIERIIKVEPDMSTSPNGVNTHDFIAIVELQGGAVDTIYGSYCELLRPCLNCEDLLCSDTSLVTMTFTLPSDVVYTSGTLALTTAGEDDCIDFMNLQWSYEADESLSENLDAWASAISQPTQGINAEASGNTLTVTFTPDHWGPECSCGNPPPVNLTYTPNLGAPVVLSTYQVNCCSTAPGETSSGDYAILSTVISSTPFVGATRYLIFPEMQFNPACLSFSSLWQSYERTENSMEEFLAGFAAYFESLYPGNRATYDASGALTLMIPQSALMPACNCTSGTEFTWAVASSPNPMSYSFTEDIGELSCCNVHDLKAERDNELALAYQQFQSGMQSWYTTCGDTPDDLVCQAALDDLYTQYETDVAGIHSTYDSQIEDLETTCYWEPVIRDLDLAPDCHPDIVALPTVPYKNPCVEYLYSVAEYNAEVMYQAYLDSIRTAVRAELNAHCMQSLEMFSMSYSEAEYHFTLYYYDQAGNLVKTVPPKAVKRITSPTVLAAVKNARDQNTTPVRPDHHNSAQPEYLLCTDYRYNSFNQPIAQKTPDGGTSEFWYDEMGRLLLSQNAKQRTANDYSYTFYDQLGRIIEVGQLKNTGTMNQKVAGITTDFMSWLALSAGKSEVTSTYYDQTFVSLPFTQQHLRKRVTAMTYEATDDGNAGTYDYATHYSYDIHGNAKQVWNENKDLAAIGQDIKTVHYYYDLVSGNINAVAYHPEGRDRFFHKYEYDADNRLQRTQTWEGTEWGSSNLDITTWLDWKGAELPLDAITIWPWDRDGYLEYYQHGPLARKEIGRGLQGIDYVYTVHGWLKGVNSNSLNSTYDPGRDGDDFSNNPHLYFGEDVYSYTLDYYTGDYKAIGGTNAERFQAQKNASGFGGGIVSLYNGNIAAMTTTLSSPLGHRGPYFPHAYQYRYDQVNRITRAEGFMQLLTFDNEWYTESVMNDYLCSYTYDANGNLRKLFRNGATHIGGTPMDDFTYHYYTNTNRLEYVDDPVATGAYIDDIDDQAAGNYVYDAIGNIIQDASQQISNIEWTVYGKVKSVTRSSGSGKPDLSFTYSPSGLRLSKTATYRTGVTTDSVVTTYYAYDATGNVMAIYVQKDVDDNDLYLTEHLMYGGERLGIRRQRIPMQGTLTISPDRVGVVDVVRGLKNYELTNHLGNVLSVISDKRRRICEDGEYLVYRADILISTDYYPFGSPMPGRVWEKHVTDTFAVADTLHYTDFESGSVTTIGSYDYMDGWRDDPPYSDLDLFTTMGNRWLEVSSTTCTNGIFQDFVSVAGETYTIEYDIDIGSSGGVNLLWWSRPTGGSWTYRGVLQFSNTNGHRSVSFTVPTGAGEVRLQFRKNTCSSTPQYFLLDNIWIYDLNDQVVTFTPGGYRFGFNGQEKDDEIQGAGMAYTAEYWEYDPRIGRRWNIDPITYPYHSPYVTFNNNPVLYNDPSGLEPSPKRQARRRARELEKQGMTDVEVNTWKGKDGRRHASVDWTNPNEGESNRNTSVFREDEMKAHNRNERNKAWSRGDWVKSLNYEILYLFGSDNIYNTEKVVVAGGEVVARTIVDMHPAVGTYNVGNGIFGNGTDIYGDGQNAADIALSGFGFIPIGKLGKFSYGLIGKLGKNYKIIHQGNLTKYLIKKGWTADEVMQVIENNNKVLHKTPADNYITNKKMYRYTSNDGSRSLIMDEDGIIIQLQDMTKQNFQW